MLTGKVVGSGAMPVWGPASNALLTSVNGENEVYLTAYAAENSQILLPPLPLETRLEGISWALGTLPNPLPFEINTYAQITPSAPSGERPTPDLSLSLIHI